MVAQVLHSKDIYILISEQNSSTNLAKNFKYYIRKLMKYETVLNKIHFLHKNIYQIKGIVLIFWYVKTTGKKRI